MRLRPFELARGGLLMSDAAWGEAMDRLCARHPQVPAAAVEALFEHAMQTVQRLRGERDPELAEHLTALRLDVRTRRYA